MAAVTQQQLDAFAERIDKSLEEIKALVRATDERVRTVENKQAGTMPLTNREISSLKSHQTKMGGELAALGKSVILLESTVKQQAETVVTLSKALPEMANFVRSLNTWLKWIGGIAAVLIAAGLIFWFGWR
jgi:uncharacterized protein YydD (DUF2326 family)